MELFTLLLEIFKPDFVFSLTFFVAFIGFGVFFSKSFWPWFKSYLDRKLECDYQISRQRWEVLEALAADIRDMRADFSAFHENQRRMLDHLLQEEI